MKHQQMKMSILKKLTSTSARLTTSIYALTVYYRTENATFIRMLIYTLPCYRKYIVENGKNSCSSLTFKYGRDTTTNYLFSHCSCDRSTIVLTW